MFLIAAIFTKHCTSVQIGKSYLIPQTICIVEVYFNSIKFNLGALTKHVILIRYFKMKF